MIRTILMIGIAFLIFATLARGLNGDEDAARQGWELIEEGALVIDVRSDAEYAAGHLEGALHIPYEQTDEIAAAIGDDRQRPVVFYCGSGRRAGIAIEALEARGYASLFNATGLDALEATRPEGADRSDTQAPADCREGC